MSERNAFLPCSQVRATLLPTRTRSCISKCCSWQLSLRPPLSSCHAWRSCVAMPSTSPWCSMSWRCCCCRPPFTHNYVSTMGPLWKDQLLSHWGRVTHICVIKLSIIGSDNGLSPGRRQAIIWTSAETLLISALRTNFSEIFSDIQMSWFKKIHLKMSSENGGHFVSASMCYGLKCEVVSYEGWNKPNSLWMLYIVVYMIIWMYFLVYYVFLHLVMTLIE